ncbi:hypothetical protein GSI_07342 [Ganoderma sinense ZZ0214-1]|uniref:Uncharacterized protein n=1 Tax=Ganoderma sinense ZZ0214-1 TaxID=1077348 RepID=A0A2G8SA53_9APHY|nr:hypothetical protein GSI_07342 [Ganoderma sinense ZZ0214-1]
MRRYRRTGSSSGGVYESSSTSVSVISRVSRVSRKGSRCNSSGPRTVLGWERAHCGERSIHSALTCLRGTVPKRRIILWGQVTRESLGRTSPDRRGSARHPWP